MLQYGMFLGVRNFWCVHIYRTLKMLLSVSIAEAKLFYLIRLDFFGYTVIMK